MTGAGIRPWAFGMNIRIVLWSVPYLLAGFLFGVNAFVIPGVEQTIQVPWICRRECTACEGQRPRRRRASRSRRLHSSRLPQR